MRLRSHVLPATLLLLGIVPLSTAWAQPALTGFDAAEIVANEQEQLVELLDADADGYMDALSYWWSNDLGYSVSLFRNSRDGRLYREWLQSFAASARRDNVPMAIGDWNGDGGDDFAYTDGSNGTVYYQLSDGYRHTLRRAVAMPGVRDLKGADFTGDARAELAVLDDRGVSLLRYDGLNFVPEPRTTLPESYEHLSVADVDGNGSPDVIAWGASGARLVPIVGGVPTVGSALATPAGMLTAGDMDGDGDTDVAVFGAGTYQLWRCVAEGVFMGEPERPGGPATALADVDGDGDLDGICCGGGGGGGTTRYNSRGSIFEVSFNGGNGDFSVGLPIAGLGATKIAGAADLDHDGDVDLVAGRCVYYADGPIRDLRIRDSGWQTDRSIDDLDGDGDPDLQLALDGALLNTGWGRFVRRAPLTLPDVPGSVLVGPGYPGDWDGDGDADLLVEETTSGSTVGMRLLRRTCLGALAFEDGGAASEVGIEFTSGLPDPERARAADADGDGDLDVFVRSSDVASDRTTRLWINDGTGFFAAGPTFPDEWVLHVADLDGDTRVDLVLLDESDVVQLRRGIGDGSFGSSELLFEGHPIHVPRPQIEIFDFDRDGDLDLAEGGQHLYLNDGGGSFTNVSTIAGSSSLRRSMFVDVNGDGWLDLVGCYDSPSSSYAQVPFAFVWPRTGPGFDFGFGIGLMMQPSTFADVDGDGDVDLIGDRVYLNRHFDSRNGGSRRQYGSGLAGSGGITPILGATGPFRPGETHAFIVEGGLGAASMILIVGNREEARSARGGIVLVNEIRRYRLRLSGIRASPASARRRFRDRRYGRASRDAPSTSRHSSSIPERHRASRSPTVFESSLDAEDERLPPPRSSARDEQKLDRDGRSARGLACDGRRRTHRGRWRRAEDSSGLSCSRRKARSPTTGAANARRFSVTNAVVLKLE